MSTKFFTNHEANTLLNKLEGVFEHNKDIEVFDALVGYFRASGYFAIRPFLNVCRKFSAEGIRLSCYSNRLINLTILE